MKTGMENVRINFIDQMIHLNTFSKVIKIICAHGKKHQQILFTS